MDKNKIIEISNAIPRLQNVTFTEPINWTIRKDEHWALIGPNGGGKSLLIDILIGKYALRSGEILCYDENGIKSSISHIVKLVAFKDIYNLADLKNSYYQQRWNKGDEQEMPLVKELLLAKDSKWLNYLISSFAIEDLMNKDINLLSSGELRKFLIVRSLSNCPRVLILDNPYIGLDASSREILNNLLKKLSETDGLQLILVVSNPKDIPDIITHVLPVKDRKAGKVTDRKSFIKNKPLQAELFYQIPHKYIKDLLSKKTLENDFENAIVFKNIRIKYGERIILDNINWQVKKGEKWALLGENGAGKSTLLSLVAADNPQAYANDITLFDRKRGTGESIWDIKKRIGYISPEMHLYYQKNTTCINIVGSGFFDTIGLYLKCNREQEEEALKWMDIFGVGHLKETSFLSISTGEQRLVLLARTFVKQPDLLILDEPLHGLDILNKQKVKKIIEEYSSKDKVLIYVTHYEDEIPSVIDKRLVLRRYLPEF